MNLPPLPELWPHQQAAVETASHALLPRHRGGKDYNLVCLEGPTGAGKTIIGEAIRRVVAPQTRSLYVCSSKVLQDQVVRDPAFAHAVLLKGRNNYLPLTADLATQDRIMTLGVTCEDCNRSADANGEPVCEWCDEPLRCPYTLARESAVNAPLAILNTYYWLSEANYVGKFKFRDFAILDEADTLDQVVTQFAEIHISERRLRQLGVHPPGGKTTGPETAKEWRAWIDMLMPKLQQQRKRLEVGALGTGKPAITARRDLRWTESTITALRAVRRDLELGKNAGWVRSGDIKREVIWRPLWPTLHAQQVLWSHASKWLLMSATVVSAEELLDRLGWQGPYEVVNVPAVIPAENRLIHYLPVAEMTYKAGPAEYEKMIYAIRQIAQLRHPNERIVVHTVSYQLADKIVQGLQGLGRQVITYSNSRSAETAIEEYLFHSDAILVAPSQERGLDLPGDLCRCQIIAKVPYLSLGDQQVSARIHPQADSTYYGNGQLWYSLEALRRIIQMSGRGVRGIDDSCATYVLDQSFYHRLWKQVERHVPAWWKEAVQWNPDPELLALVGIIPSRS